MFWNKYPYTNFHELNLDWILQKIKEMDKSLSEFEALNKITFDGEWDITKQYPAWCIVNTNGGTEGYISLKPVPAGVTIDNTEYWVSIVNYTATIADLQNRVVALEQDVTDIDGRIDNVVWPESGSGDCVFIGDSFGSGIVTQLQNLHDFTVTYNSSVGGAGFKNDEFLGQLNTLAPTVTDPDNVKYVIAIGGTNDTLLWTDTSLQSYVRTFCDRAEELFPNSRILIGFCSSLFRDSDVSRLECKAFSKRMYVNGLSNKAEFIDGLSEAIADCFAMIGSDRVHPTTSGYVTLSHIIYAAIKGHGMTIPSPYNLNVRTIENTSNSIDFTTQIRYVNNGQGMGQIILPKDQNLTAAGQTFGANTLYSIATSADIPITPFYRQKQLVKISGNLLWLELYEYGIRIYGGLGADSIASLTQLSLQETVVFTFTTI